MQDEAAGDLASAAVAGSSVGRLRRHASDIGPGGVEMLPHSGKLSAAGVPLGAPLRTGGWRLPHVAGAGAKLLRQVSKADSSKRGARKA